MKGRSRWLSTVLIVLAVIVLGVAPLILSPEAEFGGSDDQATELIQTLHPGYKPWFSSLLEPKSGEIESLLFALQAAIGSAIVFFGIGYFTGKSKRDDAEGRGDGVRS